MHYAHILGNSDSEDTKIVIKLIYDTHITSQLYVIDRRNSDMKTES